MATKKTAKKTTRKTAAKKTTKKAAKKAATKTQKKAATQRITELIDELGDWRGDLLGRIRKIVKDSDSDIVEEWKYRGTPVWYCDGMVCTGEVYKKHVKMTFPKGASLKDPGKLFNGTKGGDTWRAIDLREGDKINAKKLKALVREAIDANRSD